VFFLFSLRIMANFSSIRTLSAISALVLLTSFITARAEVHTHRSSVLGKHFMIAFPKSPWGSQNIGVVLQSTAAQTLTVTPPQGPKKESIILPRMDTTLFYVGPFSVEGTDQLVRKHKGTRIEAQHPIKMIGQYGYPATSGTFDVLPVESWGTEYFVACAPEGTNGDYASYPSVYSIPEVLIIAYYPNTSVSIFPTTATAKGNQPGNRLSISLDSADTYLLTTAGSPTSTVPSESVCEGDFSGTMITSSRPVGVIVAQTHTSYPCGNNECGDYGVEWLPPTVNLDTMYVITPSVRRAGDITGEGVRIAFCKDNTTLWATTKDGRDHIIGTYNAGVAFHEDQFSALSYPLPLILHANNPFLPLITTAAPQDCGNGSPGNDEWTFTMTYPPGVHSWSNDVPILIAKTSIQTVVNFYFHESDKSKLLLNDTSFAIRYPNYTKLPYGLAWAIDSVLEPGLFYRVRGIDGAQVGGTMYGHGSSIFAANDGDGTPRIQTPLVKKSFGNGFGGSCTAIQLADTIAPRDTIIFDCGHWDVMITDDEADPPASGLALVDLMAEHGADSSYNVKFNPEPQFDAGRFAQLECGIDVVNLAQPARAVLRVRDLAGNQRDTVLLYNPVVVDPIPATLDVGAVRAGDAATASITLHNHGAEAVTFTGMRLRTSTSWTLLTPPSPAPPFTVASGDSARVTVLFTSSSAPGLECAADTLLIATCKEFPIAAMIGCNKRPAIMMDALAFGDVRTDSAQTGGQVGKQALVRNSGTDDLHVTDMQLVAVTPGADSDFTTFVLAPTNDNPWVLAPGELKQVLVAAKPHHSRMRYAALVFQSDANPTGKDTLLLSVNGIGPDGVYEIPASSALASTYPNPTSGTANIRFVAQTGVKCEVRVYDRLGAVVARVPVAEDAKGRYAATWEASLRRSGVYFFDARDGAGRVRATGRVMILR
jgi:hypothetical protein